MRASPYGDELVFHKAINHFFERLSEEKNPFDALCQASEELNRVFIEAPFEKIEEKRLKGSLEDLFTAYQAQREVQESLWIEAPIEESPFNLAKRDYLLQMGRLLGDAAALLLQLQLSEKIKVKPPSLSDFELRIQACAFKHLVDFLDEIEEDDLPDKEVLKQRMLSEISSEIELFAVPSFEDIDPFLEELTEETISYFHARFHAND